MNDTERKALRDNAAFNDALDSFDTLSHYGVPGMKWGVRNADTMRKYMGAQGYRKARAHERIGDGGSRIVFGLDYVGGRMLFPAL